VGRSPWRLGPDRLRALGQTRTVDGHAGPLGKKLALPGAPHLIANVRGGGCRLPTGLVGADAETVATSAPGLSPLALQSLPFSDMVLDSNDLTSATADAGRHSVRPKPRHGAVTHPPA
jgi:hypothetical protein